MKKTIKGIYRGETFYIEKCGMDNKKLSILESEYQVVQKALIEKTTNEDRKVLERFIELAFEISNIYNEEYFAKGFEIGMKIATETFYK